MALVGQFSRLDYVKNTSKSVTIPINYAKTVHAHTQMYFLGGDEFNANCGITQVVGASTGTQNLWPPEGDVWRSNVLTITTYFQAFNCGMSASTIVNYWS